jgi:hypothetical protein
MRPYLPKYTDPRKINPAEYKLSEQLNLALRLNDIEYLKELLGPCSQNQRLLNRTLGQAIMSRNKEIVCFLLSEYQYNLIHPNVRTIVMNSFDFEIVKILHDNGFRFEGTTNPFVPCVTGGSRGWATIYTPDGQLDPEETNNTHSKTIDQIEWFLSKGYDLHMNDDEAFQKCTDLKLLEYFISKNANIHAGDEGCLMNNLPGYGFHSESDGVVVKLLLDQGADPNARQGQPMIRACRSADYNLVKLLLQYGAKADLSDEAVIEICHAAMSVHRSELYDPSSKIENIVKILGLLRAHGCDLKKYSDEIIKHTIETQNVSFLKYLIENEYDIVVYFSKGEIDEKSNIYQMIVLLEDLGIPFKTIFCFKPPTKPCPNDLTECTMTPCYRPMEACIDYCDGVHDDHNSADTDDGWFMNPYLYSDFN